MIKGIYRSASAMIPHIKKQETIANNLANASSAGYKKDMVFTKELNRVEQRRANKTNDWQTPMIDQVYTNFTQGSLDKTENSLDLGLEGDGFFVFADSAGNQVLSRSGNLTIDNEGFIASTEGNRLLGSGGPINVGGGQVSIAETGQVEVNGAQLGSILVVEPTDQSKLIKSGGNGFSLPDGVEVIPAAKFAIRQGYLESSNVEVVTEMIDMIASYRSYEADANSIKSQDDSLQKLFANVGRTI